MVPKFASAGKIIQKSDFIYRGAFRVPQGIIGGSNLADNDDENYRPLAYNQSRNSLYIGSNSINKLMYEISIPNIVNSGDINLLDTATVLQGPNDLTDGHMDNIQNDGSIPIDPEGRGRPWGIIKYNDKLIGTIWSYYDSSVTNGWRSHYMANPDNWSSGVDFEGVYKVGLNPEDPINAANGGFVGGYMATIPINWQSVFNAPLLTGRSGGPIIYRSSYGPTAWTLDPSKFGIQDPVLSTPLIGYPSNHQTLGSMDPNSYSMYYSGSSGQKGIVFPDGSDSVIFIGQGAFGIKFNVDGTPQTQNYSCVGAGASVESEAKSNAWLIVNSPNGYTCGYTQLSAAQILAGNACCFDPANNSVGLHTYTYVVGSGQNCYGPGTPDPSQARLNVWLQANAPDGYVCGSTTVHAAEGVDCCYSGTGPTDKGPKGFPYTYQVWQYDANDLAAVKGGLKYYWELIPTLWYFDMPFAPTSKPKLIDGIAYDNANQKLYIAQSFGDGNYPLIHVFQLDLPTVFMYDTLNFLTLISNWLHTGSGNASDINSDNIVNTKDLGIMMSKWN